MLTIYLIGCVVAGFLAAWLLLRDIGDGWERDTLVEMMFGGVAVVVAAVTWPLWGALLLIGGIGFSIFVVLRVFQQWRYPIQQIDTRAAIYGKPRSPGWRKVEQEHLAAHPTCEACGGKDELQVHHIEPFHLHPDKELDPANLVTLCMAPHRECHWVFGHLALSWHAWNPQVREDVAAHLKRVKEWRERK